MSIEPTAEELGIAARIWCEPKHSSKVMDSDFAVSIAQALATNREGYEQKIKSLIEELKKQNERMRKALEKYKPIAIESRFWAEEVLMEWSKKT
jgi:ABC-type Zn2+ transport system substrate-binding protein/surface adhesin